MGQQIVGLDARLKINSTEVAISDFTFKVPDNALGESLTATLTDPNTVLPDGATVDFELVAVAGDGGESIVKKMSSGNIAGESTTLSRSGDKLTLDAVNSLSDRWDVSPRRQIILYDPDRMDAPIQETVDDERTLRTEDGNPVLASITAQRGLDLYQVLRRAYVDGCKFSKVVTNIANFPIMRADFNVGQSYHKAAAGHTSLFEPVYFADDADVLYIIDAEGQLPVGFNLTVRTVTPNKQRGQEAVTPSHKLINAAILTYRVETPDAPTKDHIIEWPPTVKDHVYSDPHEIGDINQPGHALTITERHVKQFYDSTGKLLNELEYRIVITSYAYDPETHATELMLIDDLTDIYTRDWKLKIGYTKEVTARVQQPYTGQKLPINVYTETNEIRFKRSNWNADDVQKVWDVTVAEGLVLCEGDPLNPITQVPLIEASRNGQIVADATQTIQRKNISADMQYIRRTGLDQMSLHRVKIDYLKGQIEATSTAQPVASPVISFSNPFNTPKDTMVERQRREIIFADDLPEDEDPTEALQVDAGEVPYETAKTKVKRLLARKGAPVARISYSLMNFDAALRRGSIRRVDPRTGNGEMFIVTSYTIKGENLGRTGSRIYQSVEGVKVIND
jgi:hypothetical protein